MQELFPDEDAIDFISYEPLAPIENRPIYYTPLPKDSRKDPKTIAAEIKRLYLAKNKPNTMIHVSYQMAKQLAPLLKDLKVIVHDKETKQEALERFRAKGGIMLASGMAEGVDLPGDQCRLLIIPLLLYPNLGDSAVKKRMVLKDGSLWYALTTMMTTVQQLGRGVRSATDSCETYMLDCRFPNLINTTGKYLTQGLKNSIKWNL
jgi:Rad3-related DNA helicase